MKFSLLFSQNLLAKLAFARLNRINLQQGVFKFLLNLILFSFFKLFVSLKCYNCPFILPIRRSQMALDSAKKAAIVAKFAQKDGDTGSTQVQVALLSARISELTEHLKTYNKDFSSRLGLLKLVGRRKRLLAYLKRKDYASYSKIVAELNLRDK